MSTCDHEYHVQYSKTINDLEEKLRQLELRVLAKLADEDREASPTSRFLLGSISGVMIWNILSNLAAVILTMLWNLVLNWFQFAASKLSDIFGFTTALHKIQSYLPTRRGGSASTSDNVDNIHEGARALASNGTVSEHAVDLEQQQLEMSQRVKCMSCFENLIGRGKTGGEIKILPYMTNSMSPMHENTSDPPLVVSIDMVLGTTLSTPEQEELQERAAEILPPEAKIHGVQGGSTFLSATVSIATANSAMHDLLRRAIRLVKMGATRFDPACTLQLGDIALLYISSGQNVEKKLLIKGIHDVPIITSAHKFGEKTIVIKGSYLEDTEIKTTTTSYDESMRLIVLYHQKLDNGLEVVYAQPPHDKLLCSGTFLVHANKTIVMEGCAHPLVLRSRGKEIDIHKQQSNIIGTLGKRQFWIRLLVTYVTVLQPRQMFLMGWIFPLIISVLSCFLVELIIGPWTIDIITRWITCWMIQKQQQATTTSSSDNIVVKAYDARLRKVQVLAFISTGLYRLNLFLGICAVTWASTAIFGGGLVTQLSAEDFYSVSTLLTLEVLRLSAAAFFGNLKLFYRSSSVLKYHDKDKHLFLSIDRILYQTVLLMVLAVSIFLPFKCLPSLPRLQRPLDGRDFDGLSHSLRVFYILVLLNASIGVVGLLCSKIFVPFFTKSSSFSLRCYYDHIVERRRDNNANDCDFLTFAFKAQADAYRGNLPASVVDEHYHDMIVYLYAHSGGFDAACMAMDSIDPCEQKAAANIVGLWAQLKGADQSLFLQSDLLTKLANALYRQNTEMAAALSFENLAKHDAVEALQVENERGERLMLILSKCIRKAVKMKADKEWPFVKLLIQLLGSEAGCTEAAATDLMNSLRRVLTGNGFKERTLALVKEALSKLESAVDSSSRWRDRHISDDFSVGSGLSIRARRVPDFGNVESVGSPNVRSSRTSSESVL